MEQMKQIAYTVIRVFVGVMVAAVIADIANLANFHWHDWQPVVLSAVAAALVVIGNALNPKDTRYGIGA